jgi:hypothetical protein
MKKTVVGMHQPNMMPWIGYFYKIFQSDIFILVDDIQFIKTGSSYTNSVSFNERGKTIKLTVPIKRVKGVTQNINEITPLDNEWKRKYKKRIELAYCKCKYYKEEKEFIFDLITNHSSNHSQYNIHFIKEISRRLELSTEIKISSQMNLEEIDSATDRIIKLAKSVDGTHYISGRGGNNYQNHKLYEDNALKLIYSNFIDFEYEQYRTQEFVKGLSIIDAIFNIGFENLKSHFKEIAYENSKLSI